MFTRLLSDNWWKDNIARTNKKCKSHKTQGNNIPCAEIRHKKGEELNKKAILEDISAFLQFILCSL